MRRKIDDISVTDLRMAVAAWRGFHDIATPRERGWQRERYTEHWDEPFGWLDADPYSYRIIPDYPHDWAAAGPLLAELQARYVGLSFATMETGQVVLIANETRESESVVIAQQADGNLIALIARAWLQTKEP